MVRKEIISPKGGHNELIGQSCDNDVKCMFADVSWNGNVLLQAGALKYPR